MSFSTSSSRGERCERGEREASLAASIRRHVALTRGDLADGVDELLRLDGFHEVRERARFERHVDFLVAGERREGDDPRLRELRANRSNGVGAAEIREAEVHQRDVRLLRT